MRHSLQFERHLKSHGHNPVAQYRTRKQAPEAKSPPPHTGQPLDAVPVIGEDWGFFYWNFSWVNSRVGNDMEIRYEMITVLSGKRVFSDLAWFTKFNVPNWIKSEVTNSYPVWVPKTPSLLAFSPEHRLSLWHQRCPDQPVQRRWFCGIRKVGCQQPIKIMRFARSLRWTLPRCGFKNLMKIWVW